MERIYRIPSVLVKSRITFDEFGRYIDRYGHTIYKEDFDKALSYLEDNTFGIMDRVNSLIPQLPRISENERHAAELAIEERIKLYVRSQLDVANSTDEALIVLTGLFFESTSDIERGIIKEAYSAMSRRHERENNYRSFLSNDSETNKDPWLMKRRDRDIMRRMEKDPKQKDIDEFEKLVIRNAVNEELESIPPEDRMRYMRMRVQETDGYVKEYWKHKLSNLGYYEKVTDTDGFRMTRTKENKKAAQFAVLNGITGHGRSYADQLGELKDEGTVIKEGKGTFLRRPSLLFYLNRKRCS